MTDPAALRDALEFARSFIVLNAASLQSHATRTALQMIDAALSTPSTQTTAWDEARCREVLK